MIAHNYVHVLEACDRVNLIQDGEITFDKPTADTSVEELNEIVVEEYRRARIAAVGQGRPGRAMSAHAAGARVPPTGSQFLLEGEGQRAVVTEVGATLRSWRVGEREQLDTFPVDELDDDYRGKVLVPWPNRIRDARYVFRGTEYRTAISEPERGGALHGLVLWGELAAAAALARRGRARVHAAPAARLPVHARARGRLPARRRSASR